MTHRAAIIIFGAAVRPDGSPSGALAQRVAAAAAFGAKLPNALYVPTGGQGRFGPPEAVVMRDALLSTGVAPEAIEMEPTGRNTLRSAQACARLLAGREVDVFAVTSGYHMLRCVALLRLFGLQARAGRAAEGPASSRFSRRWYWRLRELPAITLDVLQVLIWRSRGIG